MAAAFFILQSSSTRQGDIIRVDALRSPSRDAAGLEGSDLALLQDAINQAVNSRNPTEIILEPRTYLPLGSRRGITPIASDPWRPRACPQGRCGPDKAAYHHTSYWRPGCHRCEWL